MSGDRMIDGRLAADWTPNEHKAYEIGYEEGSDSTYQDYHEWRETLVYRICELRAYVAQGRDRLSDSGDMLATGNRYQIERHMADVRLLSGQLRSLETLEELAGEWGVTVDCSIVEDDFSD